MKKVLVFFALLLAVPLLIGAGCGAGSSDMDTAKAVSSVSEMYKTREEKQSNAGDFMAKDLKEVFVINSNNVKDPNYEEFTLTTFYSDANWNDGAEHVIYMELINDNGFHYYGPFKGNVQKIMEEAKGLPVDTMLSEQDKFDSFEMGENE